MNLFKLSFKYSAVILFFIICIIVIVFSIISIVNRFHDENILEAPYYYAGIVTGILSIFSFLGVLLSLHNANEQNIKNDEDRKDEKFKTTFFNMLSLHQEIVNGLSIEMKYPEMRPNAEAEIVTRAIIGRSVFMCLFTEYNLIVRNFADKLKPKEIPEKPYHRSSDNKDDIQFLHGTGMNSVLIYFGREGYENVKELSLFDHYFRNLYTILRFIDDAHFLDAYTDSIKCRYEYARILRSTLSDYELIWIFYNGLSKFGKDKFKSLIEKYSLLKNIREDHLAYSNELDFYRYDLEYEENSDIYPKDDYEFFSTNDRTDKDKYFLSAFYNDFKDKNGRSELDKQLIEFGKRVDIAKNKYS